MIHKDRMLIFFKNKILTFMVCALTKACTNFTFGFLFTGDRLGLNAIKTATDARKFLLHVGVLSVSTVCI